MMNESPNITLVQELRVIGYADAFDENTVPSRVAPIFLFRDREHSHECVFPPFRLSGPYVCDGAIGPLSDFEEMVAEGLATKITPPRDALPAGMLWIDENLEPHYGPQTEENQRLREMADQRLKLAYSQFRRGQFDDALQSARWAAAADEASSPAIWLQAAVYLAQDARGLIDSAVADRAVGILQDWAQSRPNVSLFDHEVTKLLRDSPTSQGSYAGERSRVYATVRNPLIRAGGESAILPRPFTRMNRDLTIPRFARLLTPVKLDMPPWGKLSVRA